ncbi:ABC transporter ATP-binding protein [Roseomonas sp. NAR14]|uniref:ABC transporter ATP-binding protein n=1 Tax=Roseomonas acroporae TaxID=2937791 RepID=A0A9X1Y769_9PROT|nr:ABC transporter ATP-binding protein [Roseomonas acroporae]MCK8784403.1 ABC transporter ATP-binding protein [Roseomonas acroporae]
MSASLIAVRELSKVYPTAGGERVQALSRITLDVAPGEFVSLVGPSGCGKTTVMRILAGLLGGYTGSVVVGGRALHGPSRDIGVVFQDANLMPWRNVLANVMLPVEVLGLDRKAMRPRAEALLRLVGLAGFERKLPGELSGGMRQRVAIARALVHDPAILLLDEPFGALDAMTRDSMNVELARIAAEAGKTVFLITHSIAESVFLSDRVLVMSSRPGRIVDAIPIELPRPRGLDIIAAPAFAATVLRIRGLLEEGGAPATVTLAH